MDSPFAGFQPPQENWSRLPHQLIASLPTFSSLAELKVVLYVLRHTWGYQEFDDGRRISLDEFMHGRKTREGKRLDEGVGMNKQAIIDGIRRAVKHGFLQVEGEGKQGRREKFYKLAMCPVSDEGASMKIIPGQYENHTSASVKIIPATASEGAPADGPQSPKDIRERNIERKEDSPADAGRPPAHRRDITLTPEGDLEPGQELQDGDTVTVDGQTYTFKATPKKGAPGEIEIAGAEETIRNLQGMVDRDRARQIDIDIEIPATPPSYSWQRTADYTGIAHLVQSGHKRPACGLKPWRCYPMRLADTKAAWAGWRPCQECLEAAQKPPALSAQPHIAIMEAYIEAVAMPLPAAFKLGSFARLGKQLLEAGESASTLREAGNLVRAWMGSFPALPVLTWEVGEATDMIRRALALCQQGIGPEDIQAFIKEKREEQFWRGKLISFAHVAENIGIWREDLELLKQKGQKGNGTNGQQRYGFGELANATDDEIRAIRAKYGGKSYSDAAAEVPEVRRPGLDHG